MPAATSVGGGHVANVTHKGHGPVSGKGPLFDILHAASIQVAEAALPTVSLSPGITDLRCSGHEEHPRTAGPHSFSRPSCSQRSPDATNACPSRGSNAP